MLPVVHSNVVFIPPQQAPLVNTAILGSQVIRVPSDNVPPSVSNAQINNNARGNGNLFALDTENDEQNGTAGSFFNLPANAIRPNPTITLPTAFLAQLLGQNTPDNISVATKALLGVYEQLVEVSNVKYKPSNALRPPPANLGVFGALLQKEQQNVSPPSLDTGTQAAPVAEPASQPASASTDSYGMAQTNTTENGEEGFSEIGIEAAPSNSGNQVLPSAAIDVPAGLAAYLASGSRNAALSAELPERSISDLA